MNPLIHLNYRIWTLWTPDYWWSDWSPESCARKLPLFPLPILMKDIVFRMCYHTGIQEYERNMISWIGMFPIDEWVMDFVFNYRKWHTKQMY